MSYVFIDTEFCSFENPELISFGAVSEDEKHEFYVEILDYIPGYRSKFVLETVVPLLDTKKYGRLYKSAAWDLSDWLDQLPSDRITIVVDYPQDWILMRDLLIIKSPKKEIDVIMLEAGMHLMLIERGISSEKQRLSAAQIMFAEVESYYSIDPRRHHALVDAKANRYGWVKAYESVLDSGKI